MNYWEKIIVWLQGTMTRPTPYGWFHLMWIGLVIISIIFLWIKRKNQNEKKLKIILGVYGIIALLLEVIKQIIWSFNYDLGIWDYQWYAFPFQLCTTPIFVSIICLFLRDGKVRKALLSYFSFITILGSLATIIIPDSCFVETIEVNIHTMWLHCGSFVVSIYLLISKEVPLKLENFIKAILVFLIMVICALTLNIVIYNLGILGNETFNMFYISPYFISELPVFNILQEKLPYALFLITYICIIISGGFIVYCSAYIFNKLSLKKNKV